jgi:mevalonate kinase
VRGKAAGKIILLGEHAVVYGEPAIGVPLSRGVEVILTPGRGEIELVLPPNMKLPRSSNGATPESLIRAALGDDFERTDLSIRFEVPPMSGLGSSAALAVALLRARGRPFRLRDAIAVEDVAHGRSSGVDPAIAMADGPIVFEKRRVRVLQIGAPFFLVAGARGGHGGTGRSVGRVKEMKEREPKLLGAAMKTLGEATKSGERAIAKGELDALASAMELQHGILSGFGLVSESVQEVVREAKKSGALAAKMSGAGGSGGAFVALAADQRTAKRVLAKVKSLGAIAWIERLA